MTGQRAQELPTAKLAATVAVHDAAGDIAAHRLVAVGSRVASWQRQQAFNLAANLAEYCTEENPSIARSRDVADFCAQVANLPPELDRLAARIAALEIDSLRA